jgi:geranylgeranyl pyrophosphate synthase
VHDDLPAMDDDILRRGRPTTHVVHGDGMAVLAGDGLLTHAFALLAAAEPPDAAMRASRVLARAAGATGMVGGQAVDLIAAGKVRSASAEPLGPEALSDMHFRKTAALLGAAGAVGAILAGADDAAVAAVQTYGHEIGLAFQIVDDILDVEGSSAELGKTAGKDAAANKPTFVTHYGVDDARRMADDCVSSAIATITGVGLSGRLPEIAAWTVTRRN